MSKLFQDDAMTQGLKFERKVARMYRRLGWDVEQTQASNDHGADLILRKHGKTVVVQAKSYSTPVGNAAVQEVYAAKAYYEADKAWVVTDSTFTSGAVDQAKPCKVKLIDGKKLKRLRRLARAKIGVPVTILVIVVALIVLAIMFPEAAHSALQVIHRFGELAFHSQ